MRRLLFIIAFTLCGVSGAWAQFPPELGAIKDSINNPGSRFYYPNLFARYQMADSTLSMKDYHYLYYGYPEQVTYMPLLDNSAKAELENIMGKRSTPTAADYHRGIALCRAILEVEPFNLRDINALAYLYAQTGNDVAAKKMMERMDIIGETIMSTGSGLTEESPWWITYFDHAIDLMAILRIDQETPIIMSRTVEFIPATGVKNLKGYFFNFSEIYAHGSEYLDNVKAPKRKMNWNPIKENPKFKF